MIKELTMEKTSFPAGWKYKKLSELCKTGAGGTPLKSHKDYYVNGNIPWLRSGEVNNRSITKSELFITEKGLNNSSAKLFPKNSVLVAMYGATAGQVGILCFECSTNQAVCGIFPNDNIIPEFIYYKFLEGKEALVKQAVGGAQPNISQIKIKNTLIPDISLGEQKQIVATLDKAFAAIDTAKANAEQNIQNAKELFESYLKNVFDNKGDDWEEKTLGEVVDIKTGKLNSNAMEENGKYPFFTCSRKIFAINEYAFHSKAVLLAGNNASGDFNVKYYKGKFNAYQRTYVITVNSENELLYSYLKHKLLFHLSVFKKQSVGANTKFLKLGMIKGVKIILPPIEQQKQIVQKLDSLSIECEKLEAIYTQKIADLEEMKKSVLQKAFSGQLKL
mgnify:CR=1 FL=1